MLIYSLSMTACIHSLFLTLPVSLSPSHIYSLTLLPSLFSRISLPLPPPSLPLPSLPAPASLPLPPPYLFPCPRLSFSPSLSLCLQHGEEDHWW